MKKIIVFHNKTFIPYLLEEEILKEIDNIAKKIDEEYKNRKPLFLIILNGAFMFASDLMKRITIDCEISFVKLSSYEQMNSTGNVKEVIGLNQNIENREVLVVEDIIDTGNTMASLLSLLKPKNPKSIELVTLLHKPEALQKELTIKYMAFKIPNKFVVGYGLDYDGLGRNSPNLYQLEE